MAEIIQAYYEKYKAVFEENFSIVLDNFDLEAIHKMRTSTKRLRALFILVEYLTNGKFKAKKQLKKIRTLFKMAGLIREIQIEHLIVKDLQEDLNNEYDAYLNYLKYRERREIARFLKQLPADPGKLEILNDKKIKETFEKLKNEDLKSGTERFIADREKNIRKNASRTHSNERIHSNRTLLKQLYYLYELLTELSGRSEILGVSSIRLREIEQHFGDWHDLVNSQYYMNAFFKTKYYTGDKKYRELRKEISARRKKMRKEIINTYYVELRS
jgi:CHAD domain-containing protein